MTNALSLCVWKTQDIPLGWFVSTKKLMDLLEVLMYYVIAQVAEYQTENNFYSLVIYLL